MRRNCRNLKKKKVANCLPVVGIDPDEFVGDGDVGVDGLQRGVADEAAHGFAAFAAAQTRIGRRRIGRPGAVRAQRQLLNGHFDVLQSRGVLQLRRKIILPQCIHFHHFFLN